MEVLLFILSIIILIMFIIMFVFVIKIWNLHKELLNSGGYPTVSRSRAKRDATEIIEGRIPWDYNLNEIIKILSRYPDDPEAVGLIQRLTTRINESSGE